MTKPEDIHLHHLQEELGEFGRYQIYTFCFILIPIIAVAVHNCQYIFNAGALNYRCFVPECEDRLAGIEPGNWSQFAKPDKCERAEPVGKTCTPQSFKANSTVPCDAWIYESNNTIVGSFNLACKEWKRTLVGTIHSVGLFFALPLTAFVSDVFGRRLAFILTATVPAVVGFIRGFSPNYIVYMILEFADGLTGGGLFSTAFLLAMELVGTSKRVLAGFLMFCTFALGQITAATLSWLLPKWRHFTFACYAPTILFCFYYFVLEESIRWLLSNDRKAEAVKIILKAAAVNKKTLSPETLEMLADDPIEPDHSNGDSVIPVVAVKSFLKQVLDSKVIMTRLLVCSFLWVTTTFIYYGLSINSYSLAGNHYVNYICTALAEIPGYALNIVALDTIGRKKTIMISFIICGISLFIFPYLPEKIQWLRIATTMIGKLFISSTFSAIYLYTSELFPTEGRHRLLGACSMFGRIGVIMAPQTPLLMQVMESLPFLIFSVFSAIASLLMLLIPETLNMRLPDNIHQAENMVREVSRKESMAAALTKTESTRSVAGPAMK